MGIAVSLCVRASSRLRWLQAGLAASALAVPLAAWPPDCPLAWLAILAGLFALAQPPLAGWNGKGWQLDISDNGQIRVAVYLIHGRPAGMPAAMPALQSAVLLPGAVLWPWLLLLPLRLADGRTVRLLLLPDSVAPGAFRSLSVACRACAARDL